MPSDTWWNLDARKRQLIIDACLDEFAAHNFAHASLSTIVKGLGIAKGSIYQYFADKEALYLFVLKYAHDQLTMQLHNRIPIAIYAQSDMFTILRHYLFVMLDLQKLYPREYTFTQRAIRDSGDQLVAAKSIRMTMQSVFVDELITTAMANRSLRDDVQSDVLAFLVHTVITATSEYLYQHPHADDDEVRGFFDQLVIVLDQGMRYRIRK
ncbi:MAG: TetR/AcrR family transcriptional regulator [Chloroflexia bacterium]|nr:TetR/AcrR family transcriptional regulator [Chloroflexia bacterium]